MDSKTLEALERALEQSRTTESHTPDVYFQSVGLDYDTIRSVVHRYQAGNEGSRFSSFITALGIGIELGKLMSDPIWNIDQTRLDDIGPRIPFRCPVDSCSFRSSVAEYRQHPIICPTHRIAVVPGQEGWE